MFNFTPFPTIETQNLILRKMDYGDIDDLFQMRSDPRMIDFTDSKLDATRDETKAYIDKMNNGVDENKWIIWAIEDKETNKVIGSISIWNLNEEENSGELGYGIIPQYQGQGLMKESLMSVVKYSFDIMKLSNLDAYTEENNLSSIKLLERCGFVEVDRVAEKGYLSDRIFNMVVYRLAR